MTDTKLPEDLITYCERMFGCNEFKTMNAMESSPGARGALLGAISEELLKEKMELLGFEVIRIKEKPKGGFDAKDPEVRGDFYIRKQESSEDAWLVVECKNLKSNAEFNRNQYDDKEKVFTFLKRLAFRPTDWNEAAYKRGYRRYLKTKDAWEKKHRPKTFLPFGWSKDLPGASAISIEGLWKNEDALRDYVDSIDESCFTEGNYREVKGAIAVLETHMPSKRTGLYTGIRAANPLIYDFDVLAVDLFYRTGKHEFVFASSKKLNHSSSSPEHLYQNYQIDILIPGVKDEVILTRPWQNCLNLCITEGKLKGNPINESQIDRRG